MVSLLLRHGADTEMCNNADQRPLDVADDDDVIELLRQHTSGGVHEEHVSDDVKPTCISALSGDVKPTCASADQHAGAMKRRHSLTTDGQADEDVDVTLKRANYEDLPDDIQTFDCSEPLDLSMRTGTNVVTLQGPRYGVVTL